MHMIYGWGKEWALYKLFIIYDLNDMSMTPFMCITIFVQASAHGPLIGPCVKVGGGL